MSVLERAEITAKPGQANALLGALQDKGLALLETIPGCHSARAGAGIENPDKVILLVEWESLAAHEAFKKLPEYAILGGLFGPFAAGGAVEHFSWG
jgi:heme-degrading monooxygenase HmoA